MYTMNQSIRPFGITAIVGGWDSEAEMPVDGQVGFGPKSGSGGKVEAAKAGGPGLYMIEPSGLYWVSFGISLRLRYLIHVQGYYGAATGKGRQAAKAELEKLDLASGNLTLEEGVKEAARIIYVAHEDSKDKEFELEMTWISSLSGPTYGQHQEVPKELLDEAEKLAKKALEGEDEDEDKEDEEKMEE
jgi:20S proteasome subunit alpha 7